MRVFLTKTLLSKFPCDSVKLQEDWLGTKDEIGNSNVHLDSSNLHLDLVPQELILVTAPKIARGGGNFYYQYESVS